MTGCEVYSESREIVGKLDKAGGDRAVGPGIGSMTWVRCRKEKVFSRPFLCCQNKKKFRRTVHNQERVNISILILYKLLLMIEITLAQNLLLEPSSVSYAF